MTRATQITGGWGLGARGGVLIAALIIAACGGGARAGDKAPATATATKNPRDQLVLSGEEQATARIETQPLETADAPVLLRVSGRIARADDRTWRIGVRTNGLVMAVPVNLGDAVRKGQVLARYHADEVREERAKYRTAASELQRLEAAATLAKRNADRAQLLLELKAASALQVDQARQDVVSADAAVKNARIEVERATDVLKDDLRVPVEPNAGDEEADLVPIVAPAAGYVLEKNITPGRTIAPGQDAFVITDLSQVWMFASVRQDDLSALRVGQPATVTLPGLGDERFIGKITNLGQEFDPTMRVMQVRIVLRNRRQRLRPEMLANAEIPIGHSAPVLTVASDAVQQINGQDVVFVRTAADRFVVRPVRVGVTADGRTPVLDGLTAGDQVVTRGSFVLKSHLLRSTMEGE
jgi:cobalt-zinc-cadmium efflux system membrane fusion protein